MKNNEKVKSSKGYEVWAGKHNMKIMATALNEMRKHGINSYEELNLKLKESWISMVLRPLRASYRT